MTIRVKPLGKRPDYFGGEFEAAEIRHEPHEGMTWPSGPLFPEGHIYQGLDGKPYEVVVPRTVEEARSSVIGDVRYDHVYLCRPADPKDGVR